MSTLDILLPFYGEPSRLREAVHSVLRQSSPQWRLVVVDDAWPGEPVGPWLRSLGDARVEYHRNRENLGVNGNFRRCLELATAPYVTFLGGDDLLLPDYATLVLAAAERTGAAMVHPAVRVVDERGGAVRPLVDQIKQRLRPVGEEQVRGERLATSLMRGNWTYFPSVCWRRDAVVRHGFVEGQETTLDLQLMIELVTAGEAMALLPDVCFCYRRHTGSASSRTARSVDRFDEEALVMDDAARRFSAMGWARAARAAQRRPTSRLNALVRLPDAARSGRPDLVRRLLRHAVR